MRKSNYILDKAAILKKKIENRIRSGKSENLKEARQYADNTWEVLRKGMKAVGKEAGETEEMAISFFRILEHKLNLNERDDPPTKEEVKKAINQLKEVGRFSFFATMVILPGGVISLVGLELLARKFGLTDFTLIPSSFRKKKKEQENQEETDLPQKNKNMDDGADQKGEKEK